MTHATPPRRTRPREPGSARDPEDLGRVDLAVTRVQPPQAPPRFAAAIWLVGALVLLAVLKPWGGGGPAAATLRPDLAVPIEITPAPTEDRSATGLAVSACLGTGAWRVATLETWRNRDVRVWRAIEPIRAASGPLDPAIPSVRVVADVLSGLGWCAPSFGDGQPVGPAHVRAWRVIGGTARAVTLRQVQPEGGETPIAALYLPASGAWTSGLVVFEYTDAGAGRSGWFAADLQILGAAPSPPAPAATPAIAPSTSPGS